MSIDRYEECPIWTGLTTIAISIVSLIACICAADAVYFQYEAQTTALQIIFLLSTLLLVGYCAISALRMLRCVSTLEALVRTIVIVGAPILMWVIVLFTHIVGAVGILVLSLIVGILLLALSLFLMYVSVSVERSFFWKLIETIIAFLFMIGANALVCLYGEASNLGGKAIILFIFHIIVNVVSIVGVFQLYKDQFFKMIVGLVLMGLTICLSAVEVSEAFHYTATETSIPVVIYLVVNAFAVFAMFKWGLDWDILDALPDLDPWPDPDMSIFEGLWNIILLIGAGFYWLGIGIAWLFNVIKYFIIALCDKIKENRKKKKEEKERLERARQRSAGGKLDAESAEQQVMSKEDAMNDTLILPDKPPLSGFSLKQALWKEAVKPGAFLSDELKKLGEWKKGSPRFEITIGDESKEIKLDGENSEFVLNQAPSDEPDAIQPQREIEDAIYIFVENTLSKLSKKQKGYNFDEWTIDPTIKLSEKADNAVKEQANKA